MRHRINNSLGFGNSKPEKLRNKGKLDGIFASACLYDWFFQFEGYDYEVTRSRITVGVEPSYQFERLKIIEINRIKSLSYIEYGKAWGPWGSSIATSKKFYSQYKLNCKFIRFIDYWHPVLFKIKKESYMNLNDQLPANDGGITKRNSMKNGFFLAMLLLVVGCGRLFSGCARMPPTYRLPSSPKFLILGQSNATSPAQNHPPYYSQTGLLKINDYYHGPVNVLITPTQAQPIESSIAWIYLADMLQREVTMINASAGGRSTRRQVNEVFQSHILPALNAGITFDAVLWVQGESDYAEGFSEEETYDNMVWLINATKKVQPNLVWFVAIDSMPPVGVDNPTRRAQKRIIAHGYALSGPDLDSIRLNPAWVEPGFAEFTGEGLKEHARRWFEVLIKY